MSQSTPGALFTVIVGAILLFAPMWALGMRLVPYQTELKEQGAIALFGWLVDKFLLFLVNRILDKPLGFRGISHSHFLLRIWEVVL